MRFGIPAGSEAGRAAKVAPTLAVARAAVTAISAGLLLSACGESVEKKVSFSAPDHKAWSGKGDGSISGEGFLRRPNGLLARCSGSYVYLLPDSAYFREIVAVYRRGDRIAPGANLDGIHDSVVRKTQCDMQGRFTFDDLPAAKWVLFTRIDYDGPAWNADFTLVTEAQTRAGARTKIILSNPNRI
ncbi:MAG: hypothetical protein LCH38_09955 [Proteobacteria bacterium]|nr:hypothetical protein [Pseudomonadota bacterium]